MTDEISRFSSGQTLLIDADDTLWENNVYFERAITAFISYLNHHTYTREEVREALNEVERQHTAVHGYGLACFRRSLVTCFERLSTEPITEEKHDRICSFVQSIADQGIEFLSGVTETLPQLSSRHRLILVTKGNPDEQMDKLSRSGLESYFSAVEVPHEKISDVYCKICEKYALHRKNTWMIGNSPRSDINPALSAGLHAVYIRHSYTWILEHEVLNPAPAGQMLLEVDGFGDLTKFF
jgi:putative hydrolase of the HAD superfamily